MHSFLNAQGNKFSESIIKNLFFFSQKHLNFCKILKTVFEIGDLTKKERKNTKQLKVLKTIKKKLV